DLSLGVAESSMLRVRSHPGEAQRELRDHDERFYVVRPRPLSLGQTQSLPVPGRLELGDQELELYATGGHTSDGMAVFAPWAGVLVVGDYLSPVEIPMISPGGSVADYRGTLAALAPVVERAGSVVPGHGRVLDRGDAQRLIEEDLAYLDALEGGGERVTLPEGRAGGEQQRIHAENLRATAAA
ncbi:MAG TPA: MBL fold metallo-hydrolase, partial [Thermoleophilaceae bacterium]|nr:MBL fold metallo-hydrolase [Thermoleophilaceae bacterium]